MQGKVLKKRYGIIRDVTQTPLSQSYLAEDLLMPGNPNCWVEVFRLSEPHPKLLKAGQHLFRKEAELLKTLTAHPQLVTVQDYFARDNRFYLVQDWLPGTTLAEQLAADAQFSEADVIDLLQQLLDILTIVHDHTTVHGNLSPESILLHPFEQSWLLKDFGAVRQLSLLQLNSQEKVTLRRRVGNPKYCPRRWQGKLNPAYDLYSLGRIALHVLTGTSPQKLPEDWQNSVQVSDRLQTVLHGLLSQAYTHASEAQQWLRGTAATAVGELDELDLEGSLLTQLDGIDAPTTVSSPTAPPPPATERLAQRYRILESLGTGGFGRTFLAQDEQFPGTPKCVVKHLRPYSTTPEMLALARRLFLSEAEVLSRLGQHPQIPNLLAHFEENAEFYLVQDYIEGHDLATELQRSRRWSEPKVLRLLRDILEVLSFVHEQQVIHRDIKPANIRRRPDGKVVLIDFGAVKQAGEQLSHDGETQLTVAIGTPGYAPSEQTKGKPRLSSDVYAVGVIAIEALTGIDPEKLPEEPNTGELVWHDRAKVSPALRKVIDRMVRYDFRQRYASAQEALEALSKMDTAQATVVRSLEQLQESKHFPRPWLWGSIGAVLLILLTVGITQQLTRSPDTNTEVNTPEIANPDPVAAAPDAAIPQLAAQAMPLAFQVQDADYSTASNRLVMTSRNPNRLQIYSPLTQRLQTVALGNEPLRVALGPQGQIAVVAHNNSLSIVNVAQSQVAQVIPVSVSVHDVVLVSNRWVYFSSGQDNRLWGVNLQTQEVLASNEGDFQRTEQTRYGNNRGLVSLGARGTRLRYVDVAQGTPAQTAEFSNSGQRSWGERLLAAGDGQTLITNRGVRLTLPSLNGGGEITGQNLALTHPESPNPDRLAIASRGTQLYALDGSKLEQLVQFDRTTLNRQQTWQLPPLTVQGQSQDVEGRFMFVNDQGSEYYILVRTQDSGAFGLLRGTL
ncbi:MAG: protein kinase [Spirulina sp. SIO3F2]|nr:protein kinase [Spirulina sp. SIO3F2]